MECGLHDTVCGSAMDECAACQNLECPDVWVDNQGNTCDYYNTFQSNCGYYDNACGSAIDLCDACHSFGDACVDGDWVDSYGDDCSYYSGAPNAFRFLCGYYDTALGSAWDECCACGGGYS